MNLYEDDLVMLFYMQKYGFLTIDQATRVIDNDRNKQVIGRRLRSMTDNKLVGSFGGHRVGFNNVPKVYYLKKKGYQVLLDHDLSIERLGRFKLRSTPNWTDKTKHRIYLVDILLALELALKNIDRLELVKVFMDYNRIKDGKNIESETTDYLTSDQGEASRIIPDGAFILRNRKTNESGLYFIEMDMGTEGIISRIEGNNETRIVDKFKKYDEYLVSGRYANKYKTWGNFSYFELLFVTLSENRIDNIRQKLRALSTDYAEYYFYNTHERVKRDFFYGWFSRLSEDIKEYSLI